MRRARGFDVITLSMPEQPVREFSAGSDLYVAAAQPVNWSRYARALAGTAACTAVSFALFPYFELANIVMVYMLGAAVAGLRLGRGPATWAAFANIIALDFFFVPPRFSFAVSDVQYLVTFLVMLIVTLLIATLMASVRQQTRVAGARERRTALLYAMSRELAATRDLPTLATRRCDARRGGLRQPGGDPAAGRERAAPAAGRAVARHLAARVRTSRSRNGWRTTGSARGWAPIRCPPRRRCTCRSRVRAQTLGVLAVQAANQRRVLLPEQRHLLETFAGQIALALERIQLAHAAESSRVEAETESLRNTLLASISHDLRTPLAVIAGAGSALADPGGELDAESRRKLAQSIETRARDMSDVISNVLDLTRLESDRLALRRDWQTIDDLLGAALERSGERLRDHRIEVSLPPDLPAVHVDATLTVQLFANLFENAAKYTPAGTRVSISARADQSMLEVIIEDDGPGLPAGDPDELFNKFQRGRSESEVDGRRARPCDLPVHRAGARRRYPGIEPRRRRRAI